MIPSDRAIVVERFRDEIGDWRLCVLSPFGGRVHAAWGLALSARIRDQLGLESDAIWSDDGIIVHLPDAEEPPGADLVMLEPDEVEDAVVAELAASALFGARFRENAARALLIPRARPGKRTPLWQQRLKSQSLLEVAKKYGEFPIILETYRECLRDVLDVPGLVELLTALHRREMSLVEVETATASPFASSLLFDYVATYMYEGDTPNAERRAAALSLDRELLRELLGQEELRDLIDPGALEQVEDDLQFRSEMTARDRPRRLARRAARRRGPDRGGGCGSACSRGSTLPRCSRSSGGERRAITVQARRRGALDRRRRRRPVPRRARSGAARRVAGGVPRGRARRAVAARPPLRRDARPVHGRRAARALRRRLRRRAERARARRGARPGRAAARAEPSASGATPRCSGGCAAPRWRCCARRSSRSTRARSRASCRPGRESTATRRRAPASTGCARCWSRCRAWRCRPRCGSATCCRGARARTRRRGSISCARAVSSCGSAPARSVATPGGSRCTSARTCRCSARRRNGARVRRRSRRRTTRSARGWPPARASSPTCSSTSTSRPRSFRRRCGIWRGPARRPTTRSRRCGRRG